MAQKRPFNEGNGGFGWSKSRQEQRLGIWLVLWFDVDFVFNVLWVSKCECFCCSCFVQAFSN